MMTVERKNISSIVYLSFSEHAYESQRDRGVVW